MSGVCPEEDYVRNKKMRHMVITTTNYLDNDDDVYLNDYCNTILSPLRHLFITIILFVIMCYGEYFL
jgi:trehalose-6-phosphate synthase